MQAPALVGSTGRLARRPALGVSWRPSPRLAQRRGLRVTAFWPQSGKSDGDFTDDEILTAAAMSGRRGSGGGRQHVAQGAAPPADADAEAAPRQSPWQFAVAFAFVTVGAFFVGRSVRKYILQPSPSADLSTDGGPPPGRRAWRAARAPPSVQDLLRRHGGDEGPAVHERPASSDALLSSAAAETSRAAKAEVRAAAAARSAAAPTPAAAPPAAEAPAPAAGAPPAAATAVQAQQPAATTPQEATAPAAAAPSLPASPTTAAATQQQQQAPQQQAPQQQPAQQQQQQQPAAAAPQQQQEPDLESWCDSTLRPAVAAADAAAAAAANLPAALLLALDTVWVLCLQRPDGATAALRLAMPVPEGGEEKCLAVLQDKGDAAAVQRALLGVTGVPTVLQARPAAALVADAAAASWGVALYPAGSGLADALGEAIDAAVRLELLGSAREMSRQLGVEGEVADQLPPEEDGPDPADLMQRALQGCGTLLGPRAVADAARLLPARQAAPAPQQGGAAAQQAPSQQAEQASADAQQQRQQQQQQQPETQQEQQPATQQQPAAQQAGVQPAAAAASAGAAPSAVEREAPPAPPAAASGAARWDPTAERLPGRRRAAPGWWLTLSVLHVPQLVYADGTKGLMSVRCSLPMGVGSDHGASGSNGASGFNGGSAASNGGGQATAAMRSDVLLVAFADIRDAEPLADCTLPQGDAKAPTAIQVISVAPEQLRKHAESSSCRLTALPAGALALPPQATYDQAVAAVQAAAERQWHDDLLAAAEQAG